MGTENERETKWRIIDLLTITLDMPTPRNKNGSQLAIKKFLCPEYFYILT